MPWARVDPLGDVLHVLRMSGAFYCRTELTEPWGLEMPAFEGCVSFHLVTAGSCVLEVSGLTHDLRTGDLVLVPHGRGHVLRSFPGAGVAGRVDRLEQQMVGDHYSVLRVGGGGDGASLLCGILQFEHPTARRLLDLLPPTVHVRGEDTRRAGRIGDLIALVTDEACAVRPGGEAVITRLADVVVIEAIRSWIEDDDAARAGWLAALRDPQVGRALALVHADPGRPWTLGGLAHEVAMSRSSFAARFTGLVGEAPMRYVMRWRMEAATVALEDGREVGAVARELGYASEAAFNRAYKRLTGRTPGAVRRGPSARAGGRLPVTGRA
ncbi:AraC family transcriptional regulator [Georgenia sp. SUBG003]|uniref:AraC family transcriptional regulator n=1 Tax=Georgenia sp. SUBG003 TaxID=1497974 RepID=UPI0006942277